MYSGASFREQPKDVYKYLISLHEMTASSSLAVYQLSLFFGILSVHRFNRFMDYTIISFSIHQLSQVISSLI